MNTLTKEWLQNTITSIESARDEIPFGLDEDQNNMLTALKIALASLEAKPIGAFHIAEQQVDGTSDYIKDGEWPIDNGIIEVYAAPPMPVVPEEKPMPNPLKMYAVDAVAAIAEVRGWNACRAAMLHAEPVSNSDELPLDYLQGHKDGLEWAAQQAEANHPQTGDWLYDDPIELARAIRKGPDMPTVQGGNSPVTPDGWISCSERMPEDTKMLLAFSQGEIVAAYWNWVVNPIDYKKYRAFTYLSGNILDDVTHWMPLPEPPQEVK
ncbi:DUF551 domain-containing protein [Escherichia coli]|nr:DUF551 domain-containing protein [Escherichia coli]EEW9573506.1 DUF551 domain-containing protein [Escherichia coli]EFF8453051.1 DUF551 domain-containing protein [Escherichia coli]EFP2118852.1 DUF551 domain-containing protein [Escherichia coli]EHW3045014.1 DUF551 domain-containing protein [Escherichia coli]